MTRACSLCLRGRNGLALCAHTLKIVRQCLTIRKIAGKRRHVAEPRPLALKLRLKAIPGQTPHPGDDVDTRPAQAVADVALQREQHGAFAQPVGKGKGLC